jgi:hypothetical protein
MSAPRRRSPKRFVAVRLEGGLGDHILGMRVLRFVRDRYPRHEIVALSDAHGLSATRSSSACTSC